MTASPQDFEKLGAFYLGRPYDLDARAPKDGLLLYDSRDLVTHAVCVGMTGSGKTGLCVSLIEEAAIDGVPAIVIDPKGDLSNLLLTFPSLAAEEFAPWLDPDEARRKGLTPEAHAEATADTWRRGLAAWGQDGARIRRLRESADFALYTPGSKVGLPLSVLGAFEAPEDRDDTELLRARVTATASSLLALLGIDADPMKSREHILISNLLQTAWSSGQDLELPALLRQIQTPPMARIGILDLETFYPAKERFELVLALNNLLASPGFAAWLEGEPLDVASLLYSPSGKPRISILSIAHLGDQERMFFVTLLLHQVVAWMRTQPGTTSLRALLYMDEIAGYFPPVANPPSKPPLMLLLKQARAFGLGVVLATQNPVDLDYKGLSNAGTWFIGRLQTERDKARVLDGLEGAATTAGQGLDRAELDRVLSGLGNRVFLMNDVHEDGPVVFETRWTLSYLRGPMTRRQLEALSRARPAEPGAPAQAAPRAQASAAPLVDEQPALPPEVPQFFVRERASSAPEGAARVYHPALLGAVRIAIEDKKTKVSTTRDLVLKAPITDAAVPVSWDDATEIDLSLDDLEKTAEPSARFEALPPAASKPKSYEQWSKQLVTWVAGNVSVDLWRSPSVGLVSAPDESERDFRARLQLAAREERDRRTDALRKKYAPKLAALEQKVRKAEDAIAKEQSQVQAQHVDTALSIGQSLIGAMFGRKTLSSANLGRASSAARSVGRAMKERGDVERAIENRDALATQLASLEAELQAEVAAIEAAIDPRTEALERLALKPTKSRIEVRLVALVWTPEPGAAPAT
ncbi:DUF87 domain-containing protein [Myxococcota bacterium]|nr:DUF87 domain-containing protein [Myxococcota bacterium]